LGGGTRSVSVRRRVEMAPERTGSDRAGPVDSNRNRSFLFRKECVECERLLGIFWLFPRL